jgi:nitrate reductase gamma subunit
MFRAIILGEIGAGHGLLHVLGRTHLGTRRILRKALFCESGSTLVDEFAQILLAVRRRMGGNYVDGRNFAAPGRTDQTGTHDRNPLDRLV